MAIIAKEPEGGTYIPAPEGRFQAVCCDVVDKGLVETVWNGQKKVQHKIQVRWFIDEEMPEDKRGPDGIPYYMVTGRYTLSLYETSNLRKLLTSWRGRSFTEEELKGFDLEHLIGANGEVVIAHNNRDGKTYANVVAVIPLKKGAEKMEIPAVYVRAKDRPDWKEPVAAPPDQQGGDLPWPGESDHDDFDDDLPF